MFNQRKMIVSLALVLFTASASADSLAYVVTDSDQFGTLNLSTGAFRQIGVDTPSQQFNLVPGPNGSLFSLTLSGNLESINTATGATTVIGATGLGAFNVGDLAEVDGILYATDGSNNLYTVNATTGAARLIGPTGIPAFAIPPTLSDESLYGVGGKLYATFDNFNLPLSSPVLITPPALYQINTSTGAATEVGPTMLNLSASVDANGTFYVFKEGLADPTCVGPAPVPCRSDAEEFTLNLANGNTSFVTDVSPGATAIYGASPVVPEPASVALAGMGIALILLSRRHVLGASSIAQVNREHIEFGPGVNRTTPRLRREKMKCEISVFIFLTGVFCTVMQAASSSPDEDGHSLKARLIEFDAPDATTSNTGGCALSSSCGTLAYANNDRGEIVGYYTDANVVPHAFIRKPDGRIISFDAPGAGLGAGLNQGTVAYSINNIGEIAGQFQDPNNVYHGFIRFRDGRFSVFEAADAGTAAYQGTFAWDINIEGASAGVFYDSNNVQHGFVRERDGTMATFDPPNSVGTMVCEETCLNAEGAITGFFVDLTGVYHGFVRERDGTIRVFDAPEAGTGIYQGTYAASINREGTITGYVLDSNSVAHGFMRNRDGLFSNFDVPGAGIGTYRGTTAFSINSRDAVTGEWLDGNSVMHGFSRSHDGALETFSAPDASAGAGQGTRPSTNNLQGQVTGWYVDANNLNHGFLWER